MASSTFEVTETENETEKDISFRLEACEENGIGLSAQVDEVPKDHNYTKDPDESEEDGSIAEDSKEETNEKESSPDKIHPKGQKSPKGERKVIARITKRKRGASPKKGVPSPKKGKAKKDVLTEDSNKTEDNSQIDKVTSVEESPRAPKRGRKRKVEEKENVIDRSIMEEVQNINEGDSATDVKLESPVKKRAVPVKPLKSKTPKKSKNKSVVGEDNLNTPKGWNRQEVIRKSGKSAGKIDVYYYSPDGIKFRSRPDIAAYLARTKSNLKLTDFSFGRIKGAEEMPVKVTPKKEKSAVIKPKSTSERKKVQSTPTPSKKRKGLVVKLNFSPKKGNAKKTKVALKPKRLSKGPVKRVKASGSVSKASKKKKSA